MTEPIRLSCQEIPVQRVLQVFTTQELIDELRRRKVILGSHWLWLTRDWAEGPHCKEKLT